VRELGQDFAVRGFNRAQLDLGNSEQLRKSLGEIEFHLLLNAAALTNVDFCEDHRAEAMQSNAEAPRIMADLCAAKQARFIHFSTDYVFEGEKPGPLGEEDVVKPISVYGESKRAGELEVLHANPAALVVRVSWVFGPDRPSFVDTMLKKARSEEQIAAVADKFSTPTYTRDIAELLRPMLDPFTTSGLLHIANRGACSWQEYLQWALDCCHRFGVPMTATKVGALSLGEMKIFVARRPVHTVLSTDKYERLTGTAPRDWHEAVEEYVRDHYAAKL
jgi:dTDP-4-dehydrorhamnose reductase